MSEIIEHKREDIVDIYKGNGLLMFAELPSDGRALFEFHNYGSGVEERDRLISMMKESSRFLVVYRGINHNGIDNARRVYADSAKYVNAIIVQGLDDLLLKTRM